ncbi:MAG: DUF4410 domain-containing protein [Thiobacillus sp.]|nr:DUF4410 domain-containing protein [Thiobacillus sp.]
MNKKLLSVVAAAFILAGCASGVTRAPSASAERVSAPAYSQFASVSLSMSAAAKEKALENLKFNPDELLSHVKRALDSRSLISASGNPQLPRIEVVVKDMRVRSNFSAIMWGFMAGSDSIEGEIVLTDALGKEIDRFVVSTSYALGGIAGGQDGTRMSWLYEKFAEETVKELSKQQKSVVSQR